MKYSINVRTFKKLLKHYGFGIKRQNGSHAIYSNGNLSRVFTMEKQTHTYSQGHLKKLLKDFNLSELKLRFFLNNKYHK
ncbi:type II toxin-antitoxin system HicA family toxin [Sulfurimonas gotlandica]